LGGVEAVPKDSCSFPSDAELEEKPLQRGVEFPLVRVFLAQLGGDLALLSDGVLAAVRADSRHGAPRAYRRKTSGCESLTME
jgi:hypothetical protein